MIEAAGLDSKINENCVKLIVETSKLNNFNLDFNIRNKYCKTALIVAAQKGFLHNVKYLVEHCSDKIDFKILDNNNENVLITSIVKNEYEIVEYLLTHPYNKDRIDLNVCDINDKTALMKLMDKMNNYRGKEILEKNINNTMISKNVYVINIIISTIRLLLSDFKELNLNIQDCDGNTVLFYAVNTKQIQLVEQFINYNE